MTSSVQNVTFTLQPPIDDTMDISPATHVDEDIILDFDQDVDTDAVATNPDVIVDQDMISVAASNDEIMIDDLASEGVQAQHDTDITYDDDDITVGATNVVDAASAQQINEDDLLDFTDVEDEAQIEEKHIAATVAESNFSQSSDKANGVTGTTTDIETEARGNEVTADHGKTALPDDSPKSASSLSQRPRPIAGSDLMNNTPEQSVISDHGAIDVPQPKTKPAAASEAETAAAQLADDAKADTDDNIDSAPAAQSPSSAIALVYVTFDDQGWTLFPCSENEMGYDHLLVDESLVSSDFAKLTAALRDALQIPDDEHVMTLAFPLLNIEYYEHSSHATDLKLMDIINVYDHLRGNEDAESCPDLHLAVSCKPHIGSRLARLRVLAQEGHGVSHPEITPVSLDDDHLDTEVDGEEHEYDESHEDQENVKPVNDLGPQPAIDGVSPEESTESLDPALTIDHDHETEAGVTATSIDHSAIDTIESVDNVTGDSHGAIAAKESATQHDLPKQDDFEIYVDEDAAANDTAANHAPAVENTQSVAVPATGSPNGTPADEIVQERTLQEEIDASEPRVDVGSVDKPAYDDDDLIDYSDDEWDAPVTPAAAKISESSSLKRVSEEVSNVEHDAKKQRSE